MKRYFLHKWLMAFLSLAILASCSKKNYSAKNQAEEEISYNKEDEEPDDYRPAQVIAVSDDLAKTNRQGEMYYDNEYGYRYWRFCDGKYYLDEKYETESAKPKAIKKKGKKYSKKGRKQKDEDAGEDENN